MDVKKSGIRQWLQGRSAKRAAPVLGERELQVLKALWQQNELTASQVLTLQKSSALSLSTIQSTMERLYRKRLVARRKDGRQYVYWALIDQSTIISRLLAEIASQVSDGDLAPMISGFFDFVEEDTGNSVPGPLRALFSVTNTSVDAEKELPVTNAGTSNTTDIESEVLQPKGTPDA